MRLAGTYIWKQDRMETRITRYCVNGKMYDSIEEMPEDYRQIFADNDNDGIPDTLKEAKVKEKHTFIRFKPLSQYPDRTRIVASRTWIRILNKDNSLGRAARQALKISIVLASMIGAFYILRQYNVI